MGAKVTDSPERVSITCRGAFEMPLPAERAGRLFTPEGEREWVEGWDPRYPDPDAERTGVGTAFVTDRDGADVTWVITASEESAMRYARWDPRGIVTAVEVEWEAVGPDSTRVEVTYRSTATSDSARPELAAFAAGYDEYLAQWRDAIVAAFGGG